MAAPVRVAESSQPGVPVHIQHGVPDLRPRLARRIDELLGQLTRHAASLRKRVGSLRANDLAPYLERLRGYSLRHPRATLLTVGFVMFWLGVLVG